eukprot:5991231-Pyramimonas_sp.AAC.1
MGGGGIVWCSRCAAFGTKRSRLLHAQRHGAPRNKGAQQSLSDLRKGKDPSDGRSFGRSWPIPAELFKEAG